MMTSRPMGIAEFGTSRFPASWPPPVPRGLEGSRGVALRQHEEVVCFRGWVDVRGVEWASPLKCVTRHEAFEKKMASDVAGCLVAGRDGPAVGVCARPALVFRVRPDRIGVPTLHHEATDWHCPPSRVRARYLAWRETCSRSTLSRLGSRMVPGYPDVCWIVRCSRIDYLELHEALARLTLLRRGAPAYEYATCREAARSDLRHALCISPSSRL